MPTNARDHRRANEMAELERRLDAIIAEEASQEPDPEPARGET